MRAVVQRVNSATVRTTDGVAGSIGLGFLVFLGVSPADDVGTAKRLAAKIAGLRLFEDAGSHMNLALDEVGGEVLAVSQFTLYGDVRRGRRPSFDGAARGAQAEPVYETFCAAIESHGIRCARGVFGAHMEVSLVNDGPVTLMIDTVDLDSPRRA
jgi:D-tyrosyl-tRNA(Tyr) deacylase